MLDGIGQQLHEARNTTILQAEKLRLRGVLGLSKVTNWVASDGAATYPRVPFLVSNCDLIFLLSNPAEGATSKQWLETGTSICFVESGG